MGRLVQLTLSHPEVLPWREKLYSVRQSKLTKGTVLAGLGEKGLRKRDGQIGPVYPFSHRPAKIFPFVFFILSNARQFYSSRGSLWFWVNFSPKLVTNLFHLLNMLCSLPYSTSAALEIFALDLTSGDKEMPLKGSLSSEHRWVNVKDLATSHILSSLCSFIVITVRTVCPRLLTLYSPRVISN